MPYTGCTNRPWSLFSLGCLYLTHCLCKSGVVNSLLVIHKRVLGGSSNGSFSKVAPRSCTNTDISTLYINEYQIPTILSLWISIISKYDIMVSIHYTKKLRILNTLNFFV